MSPVAESESKDVIELLLEQHQQVRDLFSRLREAQGAETRTDLFRDLVRLLAVHETAEEIVVHPMARSTIESGEQVVQERLEEESSAKQVLSQLYDMGVEHPEFAGTLNSLAEDVTEHADSEEQREFAQLRQDLPADRLRELASAVRAAESAAPTRPHPAAGESAAGNMLAGPPVGIFDRVRDAVRDWNREHQHA